MAGLDLNGVGARLPPGLVASLPSFSLNDLEPQAPPQTPNLFTSALASGFHEAVGGFGGAAQAVGSAVGAPGIADWGQRLAQSQSDAAAASGRPDLEADPWSVKGIAYNLTKSLPSIAGAIGTGALATAALPLAPEAAGALGAGAFMFPQAVGGNVQAAEAANKGQLTPGDAQKALALGLPEAAAMSVMPTRLAGAMAKGAEGNLARRMFTGAAGMAAYQAPLSAAQTALTQAAFTPDMPFDEKARAIVQSALQGGLQGAAFGGLTSIRGRMAPVVDKPTTDVSNDDLSTAVDGALGRPQIPSSENLSPLPRSAGDYSGATNPDLLAMAQPLADKGADRTPAENVQHTLLQSKIAARTQPGLPPGEGTLFTPEDMASRQPEIDKLRKSTMNSVGTEAALADVPFFKNFKATSEPELINDLRAQSFKGEPPEWFDKLSDQYGLGDKTPAEKIVEARQQEELSMQARAAAVNAGNVPAIRAANNGIIEAGLKIRDASKLLDLHTQADKLIAAPEVAPEPTPLPAPVVDQTGQANLPGLGEKPAVEPSPEQTGGPPAASPNQLQLLSPTESGETQQARQSAVQAFQDSVVSHVPKKAAPAVAAAISKFDVASEPELINALKTHIADMDEHNGGSLDAGVRTLASEYGITDPSGGPRDLQAERNDLNDQYNSLLDRASKTKPEGQKGAIFADAMKLRNGPLEQMNQLLDLHAQADDLNATPTKADVPDRVPENMRAQWATLDAVKGSSDPTVVKAADNAQRAIEARIPEARLIAQSAIQKFGQSQRSRVVTKVDAKPVVEPVPEAAKSGAESSKVAGSLRLSNRQSVDDTTSKFDIQDADGKTHGGAYIIDKGKNLDVDWVGAGEGVDSWDKFKNSIGTTGMRSLLAEIRREYPESETISGTRVTGNNRGREAKVKIPPAADIGPPPAALAEIATKAGLDNLSKVPRRPRKVREVAVAKPDAGTVARSDALEVPKKVLEQPDQVALQAAFDNEPEGSAMKDFLGRALDVAKSAQTGTEQAQAKRVVSNALTAYKFRPKDVQALRSDVVAGPATMDSSIAHLVGMGATGQDIVTHIATAGDTPEAKSFAKLLQRIGVDSKIVFSDQPDEPDNAFGPMQAGYDDKTDTIHIFSGKNLQESMLHELTHAATFKALNDQTSGAAKEMSRLYEHVKGISNDTNVYGLTSVHEFVAEAFSNPRFAAYLDQLPPETGSRFASVWQALKNGIAKVLGLPARAATMLDQVMDTGRAIMEETRVGSIEDTTTQMRLAAAAAGDMRDNFLARRKLDDVLRDTGVGSASRAEKFTNLRNYFSTMQTMVNDFGHMFKSGGLDNYKLTARYHNTLGNQYSGVAYVARTAVDALDKGTRNDLNTVMRLATQHRFDPLKRFEQQPKLLQRADAAVLARVVDQTNALMSRIRQKGGIDAYSKMQAYNQMGHFARLATMLSDASRTAFSEHGIKGYAGDMFEAFNQNDEAHVSPEAARDLHAEMLRQWLGGYDATIRKLTSDMTSLPMSDKAGRASIAAQLEPLKEIVDSTKGEVQSMQESPYFHMGRNGTYFVSMKIAPDKDNPDQIGVKSAGRLQDELAKEHFGDVAVNHGINNRQVFIRADTPEQAAAIQAIAGRLEKEGHIETGSTSAGNLENSGFRNTVISQTMQKIISSVAHSSNFDLATKDQVQKQLERTYLDMLPDRRLVWQARENVQGASGDMIRSFVTRAQIEANALANIGSAGKMNDAVGGINADVEDAKRGTDLNQTLAMQSVQRELQQREANRIWRPTHTVLDTTRSFVHAWYLGVSPAYFALELSQMGIGAIPEMAKTHGFARATGAVAKNLPMTFRVMKWIASGKLNKYASPTPGDAAKFGVPDSIAKFVLGMSNQGILETGSMTHALGSTATDGLNTKVDNALHWANLTALYTEVAMRVNVGLASRDLHNFRPFEGGLDAFVDKNVNEGLQDFSISNSPRALGKQGFAGQLTPTITQFSGWQLRMIQKLYTEVHGVISKGSTPEQRKQSATFLLGHLGAVGALSGALGLPLLQTAMGASSNIANALSGTEQYDFENNFRQFLSGMFGNEFGDAVARGIPHLGGIDLSEFGDSSLVPFGEFLSDQRKFEDAAQDASWHAMGSSTSFVANAIKAFRDFSMGDGINGMKEALPASLKNPYEAYLMSQYGYESRTGMRDAVQPTGADVFKKAIGLDPANLRQYEDQQTEMQNIQARRENTSSYLRGNLERAISHGEPLGDALQGIMSYNMRNPGATVNPSSTIQGFERTQAQAGARGLPAGVPMMDINMLRMLAPYRATAQ